MAEKPLRKKQPPSPPIELSEARSTIEAMQRALDIEAALEQVRGRSMSMRNSGELSEVASVLFNQLSNLGIEPFACSFGILDEQYFNQFFSVGGKVYPQSLPIPYEINGNLRNVYEAWKNGKELHYHDLQGKELTNHNQPIIRYLESLGIKLPGEATDRKNVRQVDYHAFFSHGCLLFSYDHLVEETDIFIRFAKVFEQTYTRFLDLQKAEAQAREAQIESALEKVRSRTMAMQKSEELLPVAEFIFKEIQEVGKDPFDVSIFQLDHINRIVYGWSAIPAEGGLSVFSYTLPPSDHPFIRNIFSQQLKQKSQEIYYLTGEEKISYDDLFFQAIPIPEMEELFRNIESCYVNLTYNSTGGLAAITPTPLPGEDLNLMQRFSKVVDLSYTRFLDLKKAEEQGRESQIESALERVRAASMSMHESTDLSKTAQTLFKQLEILDIKTWAAGFNICEEDHTLVLSYTSLLGKLHSHTRVPHDQDPTLINVFGHWKNGSDFYSEEMSGLFLEKHYAYMKKIHGDAIVIDELATSGFTIPELPSFQVYNAAYFKFGYLMFITFEANPAYEIIFRRFAQVFEQAYIRFLDLKKSEEQAKKILQERNRLERALKDLKAAQSQLIQAEKMASLGELTAGIAHEIQNPLNFVNNFSELNEELIRELKDELKKGNLQEAVLIAKDLFQNEEKIKYHGKRASVIVQSMLQHSRTSTGQREATDINSLVEEYLRLAYHGLRAKDKSFHAHLQTELDPHLPKIKVVPQDIGRVLLNLINNSFHEIDKKSKSGLEGYKPTLIIRTKNLNSKIEISVKDNGSGIPESIKEKIFQPFFTTKPTGKGTGLGLSLSYDIVKAHGGWLEVKSNQGAEFVIMIPK